MSIDDKTTDNSRCGKNGMKVLKTTAFSMCLLASAYLGDVYNFNDRFVNPVVYRDVESAEFYAEEPFKLEKKVIMNDEGKLETYFGSRETEEFYRVRHNNHTAGRLDDVIDGIHGYFKDNVFYLTLQELIKYGIGSIFF